MTGGRDPGEFPRRVLLAVTGLSPQVVTETVFALAIHCLPPFRPTEIHLVTTAEGAERARLTLTGEDGHLAGLGREWDLGDLAALLPQERIHVLTDAEGAALDDILTPQDNVRAADRLVRLVRELTRDDDGALHVSLAGGRKTLGFFAGYALSLFGRAQDRLSHVLVPREIEHHPQFFYPLRHPRTLFTRDSRPVRPTAESVQLALIPFVRLRHGLPVGLLQGEAGWQEAVGAAQAGIDPPSLVLDLRAPAVTVGGRRLPLPPIQLAWLLLLARRRLAGAGPQGRLDIAPDAWAAACLAVGARGAGRNRDPRGLPPVPDEHAVVERVSRHDKLVKGCLGLAAGPYLIARHGPRPHTRYELTLPAEQIRILGETEILR